jgi:hypothetical protein
LNRFTATLLSVAFGSIAAHAATIEVFPGTTWTEQSTFSCPCISSINGNMPRSGNGSLELSGARNRVAFGDITTFSTNLGLLSNLTALSFEFRTDNLGSAPPNSYPIMRVHVVDPTNGYVSELIWENGETTNVPFTTGTWQSYDVMASNSMYRFVNFYVPSTPSGFGTNRTFSDLPPGGGQTVQSITNWSNNLDTSLFNSAGLNQFGFSSAAYIAGFSVGIGGGATNFLGYADNVTIGFGGVNNTYNFEMVPEPSTFALFGLATAALAFARRRKNR